MPSDEHNEVSLGKPLTAPPDFDGPVKRRCTDIIFAILIIGSWVGMTLIGIDAIKNGNPDALLNGIDYNGEVCGVDSGVENDPDLYYIRFDGTGVCVAGCPDETDFNTLYACAGTDAQYALGGSNQLNCLGADSLQCEQLTGISDISTFTGSGNGTCMYQIRSIDVLNRCLFYDTSISSMFVTLEDESSYIQQFFSDIYQARNWILGFGFGVSFILGFAYCLLLRIPGVVSLLTWGSILAVIGLFGGLGYLCWEKSHEWEDEDDDVHSDNQILATKIVGYIFWIFGGLFLCFSLFMCRRIELANAIMKESARAILKIPIMVLMPVFEAVGLVLFFVPLVYYGINVASMGDLSTTEISGLEVRTVSFSGEIEQRAWYLLFCLFWTTQFIVAMGQIVVALTIVTFYFTRDKSTIGNGTFVSCLFKGMFFHMGTAAFGSLVIAIIEMIRAVIAYFQKKMTAMGNKVGEFFLCCCQCCFWCLEKCMKFLNKNAYIQTALFSTSFCKSSKEAFFLIARNILRVGAVSMISEFLVIIMKFLVCMVTMILVYLVLDSEMNNQLYSLIGPTLFTGVLAYMVSSVFAELFSMTTSTLLQCFIADEEMFNHDNMHAEKEMKEWMEDHCNGDHHKGKVVVGSS